MNRRWISGLLTALLFALPAYARTESSGAAHVAFDVPDGWNTATQNTQVVVTSADRSLIVEVDYITSADQMRQGLAQLNTVLTTRFQQLSFEGQPSQISQAGLVGASRHGTASRNGHAVRFFALAMGHQTGGVIVVGFVGATATQADAQTLMAVLNSFRRTG